MRRLTVVQLLPALSSGGVERSTLEVGAALVAALESLMQNPAAAHAMGARARQRVVEKFSLEAEADKIAAVYRGLV